MTRAPRGPAARAQPPVRSARHPGEVTTSFAIYLIGVLVLVGGLSYSAALLGVPGRWIAVCAIVLLGACVLTGIVVTRHKDQA